MFLLRTIFLILIGLTIASVQAAVVLQCVFSGTGVNYRCTINNAVVNNPNEQVLIARQHVSGYTDAHVRYLTFAGTTSMYNIPIAFFDAFRNLYSVFAANSNLQSIGELRYCSALGLLSVHNNSLTELTSASISDCRNLKTINAANNKITQLEPGLLAKFPTLTTFDLSGNNIGELRNGALYTATSSQNISLSFNTNPLKRIEGEFNKTQTFTTLAFLNCQIDAIDPNFLENLASRARINTLDLRGNKCTNVQLTAITSTTVGGQAPFLFNCFQNFAPTPAPPTTPKPPVIGNMICKLDYFRKFFNCETQVSLQIIQ
jgi:Leucine-rich repeat (LRR) protein